MTASNSTSALLSIQDLSIVLPSSGDRAYAVERLSLDIAENEIVCLVGESGSGKSMTAHAILGLLPPRVTIDARSRVLLEGTDLAKLDDAAMRKLRGERISMVFQEPMSALNPLQRIGAQVAEALQLHNTAGLSATAIEERCIAIVDAVGLAPADRAQLPLPALGRSAPARDDRDGPAQQPAPAAGRRADHRA